MIIIGCMKFCSKFTFDRRNLSGGSSYFEPYFLSVASVLVGRGWDAEFGRIYKIDRTVPDRECGGELQ
jgi:hypothetical protein